MAQSSPNFAELSLMLGQLQPETRPQWGIMNPAQMCRHCSSFIKLSMGEKKVSRTTRIIGWLFGKMMYRYFSSKTIYTFPKNLQTLPEVKQRSDRVLDFDQERDSLARLLERASKISGHVRHPLYGRMPTTQLQGLIALHTAYHFRQFGLIK